MPSLAETLAPTPLSPPEQLQDPPTTIETQLENALVALDRAQSALDRKRDRVKAVLEARSRESSIPSPEDILGQIKAASTQSGAPVGADFMEALKVYYKSGTLAVAPTFRRVFEDDTLEVLAYWAKDCLRVTAKEAPGDAQSLCVADSLRLPFTVIKQAAVQFKTLTSDLHAEMLASLVVARCPADPSTGPKCSKSSVPRDYR